MRSWELKGYDCYKVKGYDASYINIYNGKGKKVILLECYWKWAIGREIFWHLIIFPRKYAKDNSLKQ